MAVEALWKSLCFSGNSWCCLIDFLLFKRFFWFTTFSLWTWFWNKDFLKSDCSYLGYSYNYNVCADMNSIFDLGIIIIIIRFHVQLFSCFDTVLNNNPADSKDWQSSFLEASTERCGCAVMKVQPKDGTMFFFFKARLKPQGRNLVIESGSHECMRILEKPFFLMLSEEGFCLGRCFGKAL